MSITSTGCLYKQPALVFLAYVPDHAENLFDDSEDLY